MMNVPEAIHCIGCGVELGLEPIAHEPSASWRCPRCRRRGLDAFRSDDGVIHDCRRCGGQFVAHDVLRTLVKRYQGIDTELPLRLKRGNPLEERVTYLACPNCHELMHRRNFGKVSGIIVDVCAIHGTWFDVGELPRILAFMAQGGAPDAATRLTERVRIEAAATGAAPTALEAPVFDVTHWQDMAEAVHSFARWVREMLR